MSWFNVNSKPHPTDSMVPWHLSSKEARKLSIDLRSTYDKISGAGFKEELDKLLRASYSIGSMDEHDQIWRTYELY